MSAFRVGQKVKYIHPGAAVPMGAEGVITSELGRWAGSAFSKRHKVEFASCPNSESPHGSYWCCSPSMLAPLTDPLAEQFIERIKKIAREPAPMVKEKA